MISTVARCPEEFAWIVLALEEVRAGAGQAWRKDNWHKTSQRDPWAIHALSFGLNVVRRLVKDLRCHEKDPMKSEIEKFFHNKFNGYRKFRETTRETARSQASVMGNHVLEAFELVQGFADGAINFPKASFNERIRDPRVAQLVTPILSAWAEASKKFDTQPLQVEDNMVEEDVAEVRTDPANVRQNGKKQCSTLVWNRN